MATEKFSLMENGENCAFITGRVNLPLQYASKSFSQFIGTVAVTVSFLYILEDRLISDKEYCPDSFTVHSIISGNTQRRCKNLTISRFVFAKVSSTISSGQLDTLMAWRSKRFVKSTIRQE